MKAGQAGSKRETQKGREGRGKKEEEEEAVLVFLLKHYADSGLVLMMTAQNDGTP